MTKEKIEGGAILIARQVFESEIFMFKPSIWFKIWVYILGNVFWKDKGRLKRGQGYFTYQRIMDDCDATRDQVKHCLEFLRLEEAPMIATRKAPHGMVVTVLNYDRYQSVDAYKSPTKSPTEALQKPDRSPTTKEERNKEIKKKENKEDFPEWVPQEEFKEYKKMRIGIKKPMTDRAIELAILKLESLKEKGHDPKKVLEQSTFNSWQGLFPLKPEEKKPYDPKTWVKKDEY